jgi:hypothetical protein
MTTDYEKESEDLVRAVAGYDKETAIRNLAKELLDLREMHADMLAALKAAAAVVPLGTGVLTVVDAAIETAERYAA